MDHLVNLMVVILGITIAFGLNQCSESLESKEDRQALINSFKQDLKEDVMAYQGLLRSDSISLVAIKSLMQANKAQLPIEQIMLSLQKFSELTNFTGNNVTYEGVKNSDRLNLFDLEMRNALVQYYLINYNAIHDREKYLIMNFDEYIVPNMMNVFDRSTNVIKVDFLQDETFWYTLNRHMLFTKQRMEAYERAYIQAKKLLKTL